MTVTIINPDAKITRTLASFSEMAKSVENARVWAGIHFRSADIDGTEMGRRIAEYAFSMRAAGLRRAGAPIAWEAWPLAAQA